MKIACRHLIISVMLFFIYSDLACSIYKKNQQNEREIIVVVPSYNNSQWYKANLYTILNQQYGNYHVIYIDDCSTDGTYDLVTSYVKENGHDRKITVISNKSRCGALANIYAAVCACKNDTIVVLVDGDDFLASNMVLDRINKAYADPNVWLTYGQFIFFPEKQIGECKPIPADVIRNNAYREYTWCTSHLRTFYAGLFKKIKIEDLTHEGNFFDVTWDRAFMYPMLEMSGGHFLFIPDVLYIYNCANPINDFKVKLTQQLAFCELICRKPKYKPLTALK